MSRGIRVLLVEDSEDDAALLLRELRRGGYRPDSRRVASAAEFAAAIDGPDGNGETWDVILCDYTMPGFSGTEALKLLHARGRDIPFIFVSGTLSDEMAVAAMRAGAQDYIVKDRLKRLVPAVQREMRDAAARREQARDRAQRETAERRFRQILAMAPDAIVATDGALRITIFNRAAEAVFGYTAAEVAGGSLDLLLPGHDLTADRSGLNDRWEITGRRANGTAFPAEAAISKLVEHDRTTYMIVIRDVSERKILEAQLNQAQRMEAVGQLTGGLAHDFNNLLTVVIGNLDLLLEKLAKDSDAAAMSQLALDASLRGAALTRQLLAFSRRQPLEPKVFDMNALVTETMALLGRTLGSQLDIGIHLADDLWRVQADPVQLESAFTNLAINARDAMPRGGRLTVETANKHLDADYAAQNPDAVPGDYVMLAVSDNGSGIPAALLGKVFEPFFTTKQMVQGTGLGLSMVYGFAKQSGGHVKIYSEVGHGTTVRLYLPRADAGREPAELTPCEPADAVAGNGTVLVVEDSAEVRRVAVNHLLAFGCRVLEAGNGMDALACLALDEPVDLLFTDIIMPGGMSGVELARRAREMRPGLRVLFTSGYAEAAAGGTSDLPGALISKPYRRDELARKLREVLDAKDGGP